MKFWPNYKLYKHNTGLKKVWSINHRIYYLIPVLAILLCFELLTNDMEVYAGGSYAYTNHPIRRVNYSVTKKSKPKKTRAISKKNSASGLKTVTTTYFWVGEPADSDNDFISNAMSAWDGSWQKDFGGFDDPFNRKGYWPALFKPKENPFYFALPYNDMTIDGKRKDTAKSCPNASSMIQVPHSWCKNSWIMIKANGKTVYAQWEDVGPFESDDSDYVFGKSKPKNNFGSKAGLDVSPAVKDYLSLKDVDTCSWKFVSASLVPKGPWKEVVTASKGYLVH